MTNIQLTPHFSFSELVSTSYTKYQQQNIEEAQKQIGKLYMLAGFAERVREIVGYPLIVTSGYRCNALNKYIGGALASQHMLCEAIDIVCKKMTVKGMFKKIKNSDLKYDQMIIERNKAGSEWLHISIGSLRQCLSYTPGEGYTRLN